MAKRYFYPGTFAEEVNPVEQAIIAANTSVGFMQGVFRKGPVNKALGPFRSVPEVQAVYGSFEQTYKLLYNVRGFFKNGGEELYLNRIAHYTDITDAATRTGTVANRSINTNDGGATSGYLDGSAVAPFVMSPGFTLLIDIDNNGIETCTWDAAAATSTAVNAETYNITNGMDLTVAIDGGAAQTITFVTGDWAVPGAMTAEEVNARINTELVGGSASGAVNPVISSDKQGTGSYVQVTGGTANAVLAFPVTLNQGTGDVADISAVTYAEAKAVIEADTTAATVSQLGAGGVRISSDTTGVLSEVDISGGTGRTALGLSIAVATGAASSVDATLQLSSGWRSYDNPGVEPNGHLTTKVYKDPLHASAGAGLDLSGNATSGNKYIQLLNLKGLVVGSVVKIWDAVNTEYRVLTAVTSAIETGVLTHKVYFADALVNSYVGAVVTQFESREFTVEVYWDGVLKETWQGLNMLDTHDDYVETRINDEATGSQYIIATDLDSAVGLGADIPADDATPIVMTVAGTSEIVGLAATDYMGDETAQLGIYAADAVAILIDQVAYPGYGAAIALHHLSQWCESKMFIYPTFAVPLGYTAVQAETWRQTTLGLYSKYGSLEWPGVKVYDPLSSASIPSITVTTEGHVMGIRARVDAIEGKNDGGVWSSAAGESQFGQMKDIIGLELDVTDSDQSRCHPVSINCTRQFGGKFYRYGARTLDSDLNWRYENVVRFFMFVEKSVVRGTRWAVYRNNNANLWRRMEDAVDTFLGGLQDQNAFPGNSKAVNYFVKVGVDKGTMDASDIDLGNVVGEIGLAPNKPGEFIVWRFSQFKSGAFAIE